MAAADTRPLIKALKATKPRPATAQWGLFLRNHDELDLGRLSEKERQAVFAAFGPPWFHPLGGHLFSVFPWAHLIFTEKALLRWRADFKSDGATRFCEVEGGLNQMTVHRFSKLLERSEFEIERFEAVPIKRFRRLSNALTREFLTSVVRCTLVPRATVRKAAA